MGGFKLAMFFTKKMVKISLNKKSFYRVAVLLSPLLIILGFYLYRKIDYKGYRALTAEDCFVEYATALVYLIASITGAMISIRLFRNKRKQLAVVYVFLSLTMFFVCGEEVSWAQRIIDAETPEFFQEHNVQGELSLHNLYPVQKMLHKGYVVVGLCGAFLWVTGTILKKKLKAKNDHWLDYLVPDWYLMLFFLQIAVFYLYYDHIFPHRQLFRITGGEQEPSELILSIGFLMFMLINRFRQRSDFEPQMCDLQLLHG